MQNDALLEKVRESADERYARALDRSRHADSVAQALIALTAELRLLTTILDTRLPDAD